MLTLTEYTEPKMDAREAEKWLSGLGALDADNETVALTLMTLYRKPPRMIDVGSGTGSFANCWRANGIDAYGIDRLPRPGWPHLLQADLRFPVRTSMVFDVVTCVEVAEHLPESSADILCESIRTMMADKSVLIFTAAQPGQAGTEHWNCQPSEYWRRKLSLLGLSYSDNHTFRTMLALRTMEHPFRHIEANLQVFLAG
jgi:hypothetical protein